MPDDPTPLRALAHPLRLRILSLLTGAELSAADVARELGVTHANASYHLRVLRDAGEVVVAGEEVIRGGRATRYRHPWRGEDRPGAVSTTSTDPASTRLLVRAATEELHRRYQHRRPDVTGITTDAELWVDLGTWERARELLAEAAALVHEAARPPRTAGTEPVSLSVFGFVMERP